MIIRQIANEADLAEVRRLFREYVEWLAVDLSFQNFEQELAGLPGDYAPPEGRLWIAEDGERTAGCIALRRLEAQRARRAPPDGSGAVSRRAPSCASSSEDGVCEMKRLYVRSEFRGTGLGRRLVEQAMQEARAIGYRRMRLDTLPQMSAAQGLYRSFGFREIDPYRFNPIAGTKFLEAEL